MKVLVLFLNTKTNTGNSLSIIERHSFNLLVNSKIFEKVVPLHISKLTSSNLNLSTFHGIYIGIGDWLLKAASRNQKLRNKIQRLKSFHMWFDDIDAWKLNTGGYKKYKNFVTTKVTSIFCPREPVAINLNKKIKKGLGDYIPWTIPYKLFKPEMKNKVISILVDWDNRNWACNIESYMPLIRGIKECKKKGIRMKILTRSDDVIKRLAPLHVIRIKALPNQEYLNLQNRMWIFASGIQGSYEFTILESQVLGNYIFSLKNKINPDLFIEGDTGFVIKNKNDFVKNIEHIIKIHNPQSVHEMVTTQLFNRNETLNKIKRVLAKYN